VPEDGHRGCQRETHSEHRRLGGVEASRP
jgi:hypothetical protein